MLLYLVEDRAQRPLDRAGYPMPFHRLLPSFLPRSPEAWKASFAGAGPRLGRAVYGSDLHVSLRKTTSALYPALHPLLAALRPFRRRLHWQRFVVGAVRLCSVALLTATAFLLGRLVFGPAWPLLPSLSVVGVVLAGGLVALAVRAPSWMQVALLVDRGLYLREQLETAVETLEATLLPTPGSVGARLQEHAVCKLQVAPLRALPWPSLRGERRLAAILGAVTALLLWMVHSSTPPTTGNETFAGGVGAGAGTSARAAHGLLSTTSGRNGKRITVLSSVRGSAGQVSTTSPRTKGAGTTGLGLTPLHTSTSSSTTPARTGTTGTTNTGRGQGQAQSHNGATGSARAGARPGAGAKHVSASPGANSPAARLSNPAQSPLASLQNSIDQARQQGQTTSAAGAPGAKNQSAPTGATRRKNTGASGKAGRNRTPSAGAGTRGDALNRSTNGAHGTQGSPMGNQNQPAGNEAVAARRGQAGAGQGTGHGAAAHAAAANGTARLGQNQTITLVRASGKAGQTLTIEADATQGGTGSGTLTLGGGGGGAASSPLVTVPGYVASDDNTVAPALKTAMRGYFTPKATGQ